MQYTLDGSSFLCSCELTSVNDSLLGTFGAIQGRYPPKNFRAVIGGGGGGKTRTNEPRLADFCGVRKLTVLPTHMRFSFLPLCTDIAAYFWESLFGFPGGYGGSYWSVVLIYNKNPGSQWAFRMG